MTTDLLDDDRVLRHVAPPQAPWPGALVRTADGRTRLRVPARDLEGWRGWDLHGRAHLLGPAEVVWGGAGVAVELEHCVEPLEALVRRRAASPTPLGPGESVTVCVSLLRGRAQDAEHRDEACHGTWWVTDDGRPVFVHDDTSPTIGPRTADVMELVSAQLTRPEDAPLVLAIGEAATLARLDRPLPTEIAAAERSLFAVADSDPLATTLLSPPRALSPSPAATADAHPSPAPSLWSGLLGHLDEGLATSVSAALQNLRRRASRLGPVAGRRRPWLMATGLAAVVVVGGLSWPPSPPAGAVGSTPATTASSPGATADAPASPAAAGPVHGGGDDAQADLAAVTSALLDARLACSADDADCLGGILEDPARVLPSGAIDEPADRRSIGLLDDLGGTAVLRVESAAGGVPAQIVVIIDVGDDSWVLRDVHDVAQHP